MVFTNSLRLAYLTRVSPSCTLMGLTPSSLGPPCREAGRVSRSRVVIASADAGASAAAAWKRPGWWEAFRFLTVAKCASALKANRFTGGGVFPRAEVEIIAGSWQVTGLRGTGSFDWTLENVFLPERRSMPHTNTPLDNRWRRWPGVTYSLPVNCWMGPHYSAVITGIARAGIDALIELAGKKTPRGRTGLLRESPQVQDAIGRADAMLNAGRAYRSAMITELWTTVAAGNKMR